MSDSLKRLWSWFKKIPSRTADTKDLFAGRLAIGKAQLSLVHIKADGTRIDHGVVSKKKVTGAFVTFIVANMVTDTTEFGDFKYHDSGVGATAEVNTNTAIETTDGESRVTGTQVQGGTATAPTYTSVGTISYTTTKAITEHGVFSQSSGGTLLDRSVFSAVNVVNGDSIQFTYVLTINAEA